MRGNLEVRGLETATGGDTVKLFVEDVAGRDICFVMKIETLTALLVTLPKMASKVIKRWQNDPITRVTYPLTKFRIELSDDGRRILTLGTLQGFTISFSLGERLSLQMGHAHLESGG